MLTKVNPLFKFIAIMLAVIILAFTYSIAVNLLVIVLSVLLLLFSRVSYKRIFKIFLLLLLPAFTVFLTGYLHSSGADNIGIVSDNSIINGIHLASRVFSFPAMGACFALTTPSQDFILSLEQNTPLPPTFIYGFFAAFQLLPEIRRQYQIKKLAFKNRGIYVSSLSPKLLALVLTTAVQWSDVLAGAMESRGFSAEGNRSHYRTMEKSPLDYVILFVFPVSVLVFSALSKYLALP